MCAFLDTQKLVDGCVSNDGDSFLYGASRVYRHFTLNSRDTSVVAYDAAKISTDLGLSRERLVLLGLILGCDFWPAGVPGVGAVSARTFVSQSDPAVVRSCLKLHDSTPTADKPASVQSEVWKKVKDGLCGCPVEEVFEEFLRPCAARGWQLPSKSSIIWSQPRVKLAVEFCIQHLDWTPTYSLVHFIPLFALWRLRLAANSGDQIPPEPTPIRIIRKRSINYIPSYEVEWKRLSNDIWSEDALSTPNSTNGEPSALISAFFTQEGYKFSVPISELRLAFPGLVDTYEAIGLLGISASLKGLSLLGQKGKGARKGAPTAKRATKRTNHLAQVESPNSGATVTDELTTTTKTVDSHNFLFAWDSTPETSPQQKDCSPVSRVNALAVSAKDHHSISTNKVEEETTWFLPVKLNTAFERRISLQSSLLSFTPPSTSADQPDDFSLFRTPARLTDRLK
uniref:Flap endonuclease GEN homolog 1 n=1 Tax=Schistocephalus solidus TaxID=70667 RepID=A0A0X3NI69_SCHSO